MTLTLLTAAILLTVALVFHLFLRAYVWSRAAAQLDAITASVSAVSEKREKPPDKPGAEKPGEKPPDGEPREGESRGGEPRKRKIDGGKDRLTGVRGNVMTLNKNGEILDAEEMETAEEFSAFFSSGHELNGRIHRESVRLDSGNYIVSVIRNRPHEDEYLVCFVDVTYIQAFTRQVNLVLCVIILAALVLSVFLSRWISRSFADPVQRLSAFAGEIGGGEFQRREFRFRDAEFNDLAESMNRMADELREANKKQETFFQNVSHELRTPLTSIRGNAEGIVYGLMDPQASGRIILAQTDRLAGFVEDILYLSRLGRTKPQDGRRPSASGRLPPGEASPMDLRELLSLLVSEQRPGAGNLSFAFDFDDTPVLVSIREQDARQLFGNLLSNAIRYAAETVRLSCRRATAAWPSAGGRQEDGGRLSQDCVCVIVSDDGPGIAPEDLPHIFERFYKGNGGKHGIGLSIAQSVVDSYHGEITVENNSDTVQGRQPSGRRPSAAGGHGASFTVRLPGTADPVPGTAVPGSRIS